jgi:choline-sulfatase
MSTSMPNVLFIMADQMAAWPLPIYGGALVRAPHLQRLAGAGVVFDRAYCNSPICAPSRFSMMSGQLPSTIAAWDNAAEFPASIPTMAHYFCAAGYRTILSGKMHFIGPDQQHGYEERLTTDIYPADFAWTPNWLAGPTDKPSGISMRNVQQAGVCVRSLQMDYDDEVEYFAVQRLYDLAREPERPPFFMTVSFSHPHPPYTIDAAHWDLYRHDDIDGPRVPPIPVAQRDVQSQWLHLSHGADAQAVDDAQVRAARHAYYGMISYIDDKIGRLLGVLEQCGMAEDTIVVFTSDHGEMLGERGMWYKQTFFEPSVRVPLVVRAPGGARGRHSTANVSLMDLLPTLMEVAGAPVEWADPIAGISFAGELADPAASGAADTRTVISEYTDMGVIAPCRMLRQGDLKYWYTHGHPAQLYDLASDPLELRDLASDASHAAVRATLHAELMRGWNPEQVMASVLASQRRRLFLKETARRSGRLPDWSFQAWRDDHTRYVRASGAAGAKARARFPYVKPED